MPKSQSASAPAANGWCGFSVELAEDSALIARLEAMHRRLYEEVFAGDPAVNERLGIQTRAFRRVDDWRVVLVLTPWMLSRFLIPDDDPGLPLPGGWHADARRDSPYLLLGPRMSFDMLGQNQQAHLNFDSELGHYLLQPIVLDMSRYDSPESVFSAWNDVIRTRDENMEKHRKDCPWQKEISRRELFNRFRGKS